MARPDGNFPGRGPDPNELALEGLRRKVVEEKADFGVGLDGDGDRAGFVDDKGRYVGNGSILLSIFAKYYLKKNRNAKVVYDVPCSSAVEEMVKAAGGVAVVSKTGHTNIPRKMAEESALIGGEYSNHLYFSDNHNLDDGFYAAAKMAEVVSNSAEPMSAMADSIPRYPGVPIAEIGCPDAIKFKAVEAAKRQARIAGLRQDNRHRRRQGVQGRRVGARQGLEHHAADKDKLRGARTEGRPRTVRPREGHRLGGDSETESRPRLRVTASRLPHSFTEGVGTEINISLCCNS